MALGFGIFGKQQKTTPIMADELTTDDLESKRVQEIMGISEFGRKAKTFDITVRNFIFDEFFFIID